MPRFWTAIVLVGGLLHALAAGALPTGLERALPEPDLEGGLSAALERAPAEAAGRGPLEAARQYLADENLLVALYVLHRAARREPLDPDLGIVLGRLYNRTGHPDDAAELARRLLAGHPDRTEAHEILGMAYLAQEKLPEAIAEFERFAGKSSSASAWVRLGDAVLGRGDAERALAHFEQALAVEAGFAPALLRAAALLQEAGRHAEAAARADRAVRADPKDPAALVLRAEARRALAEPAEAADDYRRAVELAPAFWPASERLADLHIERGRSGDAIRVLDAFLDHAPAQREAHERLADLHAGSPARRSYHRGMLAVLDGDAETAGRYLEEALEGDAGLAPARIALAELALRRRDAGAAEKWVAGLDATSRDAARVALLRGQILGLRGRAAAAEARYREATELDPGLAPAWLARARALRAARRLEEAVPAYERTLELAPGLADAWRELGDCHTALGQLARAERAFGRAFTLAPRDPDALHALARVYERSGRNTGLGLALARQAVALRPEDALFRFTLGKTYARLERWEEAAAALEAALARRPDEPAILTRLGLVEYRLGRRDTARARLEKALALAPELPEADEVRDALRAMQSRSPDE